MAGFIEVCAIAGAAIWLAILLAPWRPWSTRENLAIEDASEYPYADVTVLIPARNEATRIRQTISSVRAQGPHVQIVLVDDKSEDGTAEIATQYEVENLQIILGKDLPPDWTGKLWALEQGFQCVQTEYVALLDADIEMQPGTLAAIRKKMDREDVDFLSIMARLRMETLWERMLMPAFIFFFKLLYPFHLANGESRFFAAAAGGCIVTRASVVKEIGGFTALRGAIIDDCALAKRVKSSGYRIWIGLSRAVNSRRRYEGFAPIREMVARTAFTQLKYSWSLLLVCTVLLLLGAWALPVGVIAGNGVSKVAGVVGIVAMAASYLPTLKYYNLNSLWALAMPVVASIYLYMTWVSALRFLSGTRSHWKGRVYSS